MHTENSVVIYAPSADIFELGARIEDWPRFLPHYRWVTVLREQGSSRLVEMAASRDGFAAKWVSIQELDPDRQIIRYRHVRGITRGMTVEWTLTPRERGTMVKIAHDFDPPWPNPLGALIANHIIGDLFVANIAAKTLNVIKQRAESGCALSVDAMPADQGVASIREHMSVIGTVHHPSGSGRPIKE